MLARFDRVWNRLAEVNKDVSDAEIAADVKAARARFARILASMPEPKPRPEAEPRATKMQRKKQR